MATLPNRKPATRSVAAERAFRASPQAPRSPRVRRYDLFCMDAGPRPRLQLTDEGVSPAVDHLEFMLERRWQRRSYADIVAVTLQSNALPDSAVIANCRSEFEDGAE